MIRGMLPPMRILPTLLLGILGAACGTHQQPATQLEPGTSVETFDAAWRIVYETHFDTTFNGVDWLALKDELRPEAEAAQDIHDLRVVIREMLDRLGQSHFVLIPGEAVDSAESADDQDTGDAGLDVRLIEEMVLVSRVDSGGPAEAAGVESGWVILSIDDHDMDELLEVARESPRERSLEVRMWSRVMARLSGSTGSVKRVQFLDGNGANQTVEIALGPNPGSPVRFGNFPTFFNRFRSRRVTSDGVEVGVIWFNNWMVPAIARVDRAVNEFRELDGIVVDLRGNTGGLGAMVMGVAGHFYEVRTPLGTMKTRRNELEFFANPRLSDRAGNRVRPFAGPVAILTDGMTASASEMFAGGMQTTGRVRVFGETTMGAVLPAVTDLLPSGDVLYHALGDFTTPNGKSLEGVGVVPDERVPLSRDDLLAGRDPPLTAALRWIEEQGHGGSNPAGRTGNKRRM